MSASSSEHTIRLGEIAHARSGDKGDSANIGVLAYTDAGYTWLQQQVTAERVKAYFDHLGPSKVDRYELPNLGALNFVLHDVLDGGGSRSSRVDAQGKTLGRIILDMRIPAPDEVESMRRKSDA
jgi:hypothetical protein